MELAFRTRDLRNTCEDAELAASEFGPDVAAALMHRLADLRAAVTVDDLVAGDPSSEGDVLVIRLDPTHALELSANHRKNPQTPDGRLDWAKVSRLRVVGVSRNASQ